MPTPGSGPAADPGLRSRPLVLVADLSRPELTSDDRHHFERVLRLAPGAAVTLADGAGRWREGRFGRELEPVGEVAEAPRPRPAITIAFVPVKGESPEWYAQKLTELGVDAIVPVLAERSVVRWDPARAAKVHQRMVRAAREACQQCRRLHLPRVEPVTPLADLMARAAVAPADGGAGAGAVALADPAGGPLTRAHTTIVVGPEGGFAPAEAALAPAVALPGHILRAETAAVVAAAVAVGLRSGLLGPAP